MAVASFKDFISKDGFRKGTVLEERDLEARSRIVAYMNKFLPKWNLRAIQYDLDEINPCMILMFPLSLEKNDVELATGFKSGQIQDRRLPYKINRELIDILVRKAYDLLLNKAFIRRVGKWRHIYCGQNFDTYGQCRDHIIMNNCTPCEAWDKLHKKQELFPKVLK